MPIYEYVCPDNHVTEILVRLSDGENKERICDCGKPSTKIISNTSFALVGSWFKTKGEY